MKFLNPYGLWLLLGIPFLIVIFILRSKHKDRSVSSTFIWKLSNRYMKKRVHLYALSRFILQALEILAVTAAAMIVARPTITDLSSIDYIFVFDCSESMKTKDADGFSRLELAKKEAQGYLEQVADGHRISVITAGDDPVCPLRFSDDVDKLTISIQSISAEDGGCDLTAAMALANELSSEVLHPQVLLFTDRACENAGSEYTTVVDLSLVGEQINLSAVSLRTYVDEYMRTVIAGGIHSDGFEGRVAVGLRLDDKTVESTFVELTDGETKEALFTLEEPVAYEKAEVFLGVRDGNEEDNSFVLCRQYVRERKIQIVSRTPYLLMSALKSIKGVTVDPVSNIEDAKASGYDLYIYDGMAPIRVPKNASIIMFNTESSALGISIGDYVAGDTLILRDKDADPALVPDFNDTETVIDGYSPLLVSSVWKTLLTCADEPVGAIKQLATGFYHIAFSFDIHDSNLPLQMKFVALVDGVLNKTVPSLIDKNDYSVGEEIAINAEKGGALSILTPQEETRALPTDMGKASFTPVIPGIYTLKETVSEENVTSTDIYVHIPLDECVGEPISELAAVTASQSEENAREATKDVTLIIAIIMLVLLMCEWGVYLYEQY